MEYIDRAVARVLRLKFRLGLFEHPYIDEGLAQPSIIAAKDLNASVAREAIVLKNDSNVLPLNSGRIKRLAVIGPNAERLYNQLGDYTSIQREARSHGASRHSDGRTRRHGHRLCSRMRVRGMSTEGLPEAVEAVPQMRSCSCSAASARQFGDTFDSNGAPL